VNSPIRLHGRPLIDGHVHVFGPEAARPDFDPLATVSLGGNDSGFLEQGAMGLRDGDADRLRRQLTSTLGYHHAMHALASFLGCEPEPAAVLAARAAACRDFDAYLVRMRRDIGLEMSLIDVGLGTIDLEDFSRLAGVPVKGVFRIEPMIAALWDEHDSLEAFDAAFADGLRREVATGRHVALKSIIAYRTGLAVQPPDRVAAARAFDELKRASDAAGLMRRIKVPHDQVAAARRLRDHWVWTALELSVELDVPVQIHTGMGDQDLDIEAARPGLLANVFRDARLRHARVVLLHGAYPFHEEAAYLVDVFPNVYLDLSEHNLFLGPEVEAVLRPVLALAPASKLLFGTDAYGSPDLQWIAARATIAALEEVLSGFVAAGSMGARDALVAGDSILAGNARELYRL
jgi:predicted TIM-barrel fold metal-dependent hydrolase